MRILAWGIINGCVFSGWQAILFVSWFIAAFDCIWEAVRGFWHLSRKDSALWYTKQALVEVGEWPTWRRRVTLLHLLQFCINGVIITAIAFTTFGIKSFFA